MNIQISEHFNYRKLIRFTVPTIAMMIFTSIYGVVDGIFVSNFVGSEAFAAVNLIMPALMIMGSIGFMIGTGGSALVSKLLGEGKKEKANEVFSMLVTVVVVVGGVLSVIGFVAIRLIAQLLGADESMMEYCVTYGRILLLGNVPFMLQNTFQSFLVVAERPQMGLKISIAAGVTNMILDLVFVYFFRWGVVGAGLATVCSQLVGSVIPLVYFAKKNPSPLQLVKFAGADGVAELTSNTLASVFVAYDANLLAMTVLAIRLYSLSYLVSGINIFASAFFTALNDGLVSAIISFLRTLVFQIIMVFLLPVLFGLKGIWLAIVVAEGLALGVSVFCFYKFRKKYHYA